MSNSDANVSSGNNQNAASGGSENNQTDNEKQKNTVAYDTHLKLLNEKKKRDAELADAQAKLKAFEEAKLKEQGDLKALLEMRDKEIAEAKAKATQVEELLNNSVKLDAVLNKLSGSVDKQYFGLFDLSKIPIDPTTQMPDQLSVEKYAKDFEQTYSAIIKKSTTAQMPNHAAQGTNVKLTYEEWLRLPLKEQKARLKDVLNS